MFQVPVVPVVPIVSIVPIVPPDNQNCKG